MYIAQFRFSSPNWFILYGNILDGSGLNKIANGPFRTEETAKIVMASMLAPPSNPYENY